ncbi:MAG: M48 family metallopeptidase [Phycisphaerae bacterium]|nr:M48 family metallopeptidase [Phycisphaerae bacterium]
MILFWLLRSGWSARFQELARSISSLWLVQGAIYAAMLLTVLTIFELPLEAAQHGVSLHYELSVQGWGSWLWDHAKELMVTIIVGCVATWMLFAMIRRSPKRWWLYSWAGAVALAILLVFVAPVAIDPLFNKFEPLAKHDAALAGSLERVVNRAGLQIPEERMFWMKASEKTKTINAYVTGIGASKRVVVWDTTIANATMPEILYVFGHELGHYVLNHLAKGFAISAAIFLALFYFAARWSLGLLRARETRWGVRGADDFAALPVYLGCLLALMFVCTPVLNAISRYYEHRADQYGLEITHGLMPDSSQVAARTFQLLGESNLEDPAPSRWEIWWFYDHPWIGDRIQFALGYDPWGSGGKGEFVK